MMPVSLLTAITLTTAVEASTNEVNESSSMQPSAPTGMRRVVTSSKRDSMSSADVSTAWCSKANTTTEVFAWLRRKRWTVPAMAK